MNWSVNHELGFPPADREVRSPSTRTRRERVVRRRLLGLLVAHPPTGNPFIVDRG